MKTLILWSGLAASAYAQSPVIEKRAPTTTVTLLGPTTFCQGLSPGGGDSCMTISAGCYAISPSYNYVPETTCTSTSSSSVSKTPTIPPITKSSSVIQSSSVPQSATKTTAVTSVQSSSSSQSSTVRLSSTSRASSSASSSSTRSSSSSQSSSTRSSQTSNSASKTTLTSNTPASSNTKSSNPASNSPTKTNGQSTAGQPPSTNPGQQPTKTDGQPTPTKSQGTQPTGTEAADDASSKTDKAKDSNDSYQKDPTNKSLAEEVENALKDALDSAKNAVEQAVDDAVETTSKSLVDALTSALTAATTAAAGPTIAAAEALAATIAAVEAAKQALDEAKNNKPTDKPTNRPTRTESITRTSSDQNSKTSSVTITSKPTSSQTSSSSSSSSSSACPACFSCAVAAMPTPGGGDVDDIAKRAKAPFGKYHEARAKNADRTMQVCGIDYLAPDYQSYSGTKDYGTAKFYSLQWEPKKPGPNCDEYAWSLKTEDNAVAGVTYVTEHVYELQLINQFFTSISGTFTCTQFKRYFEGGTQWTTTTFGAGGALSAPGSRPIDELISALPGNANPDFAYLEAKLNSIKKNIFNPGTGTQSGLNNWRDNMVLVAQTQATFEYLEAVANIWGTTNTRIVDFFTKLDRAAAGGNTNIMKIGWEARYKAFINEKLGTDLDNSWAGWKTTQLTSIQTGIKNQLGAASALAKKLIATIETLKTTGKLEDLDFGLPIGYTA